MQACGNDYIYVNCFDEHVKDPERLAVKLADRNYGIGSDGLILIEPSDTADAFMHMFNRDGSEGKMCGNGIRCVVKYIYDHHIIAEDRRHAVIDTRAGLREMDFEVRDGMVSRITVDMGCAVSTGADSTYADDLERQISFEGIDIGNPHAVVFIEDNRELTELTQEASDGDFKGMDILMGIPLRQAGTAVQSSGLFADGVNVEFIDVISRNEIRMRVWERGSGETLACGTGAAASAAAGCMTGKLDPPVLVHLAGGDLTIDYDPDTGKCLMTGNAEYVFTGECDV